MIRLRRAVPVLFLAVSAVLSGCGGGTSNTSGGGPTGPASSATTLTASPNPAAPGAIVTLTATVSTSGSPTGTITFYDGATSLGSATLSGTTASMTVSTFAAGSTHSLTATYSGDSTHSASTSAAVSVSINALTSTTTVLTPSPNPALPGATVTLTATVTSSTAVTGTITFYDGTTALGTASLNNGVASLTISTLSTASHSLTASYAGDSTHAASTSVAVLLSVALAPSATALTATPNPATPGSTISLTATVTSNAPAPTGAVTFYDGTTSLGTGTVTNGVATLSVSTFAANSSHSLSATYGGDSTHATSTSATLPLTVSALLTTSTTLTSSLNPAGPGQSVTLTATVTSTNSVTGTVTFYDGMTSLGTATLTSGTASTSLTTLTSGTHSLTATYSGDTSHAASTSTALQQVVTAVATTTTTLTVSPNPAPAGATVSLTATVASTSTATGTVTFYDSTTSLGTASLSNGVATTTVTTFAAGTSHSLTAAYAGDSTHSASTSSSVSLVVNGSAPIDAHATFSFTTPNQTIAGFGAAEAFYLNYLDNHPYQNQIYTALFDPTAGLGLTFLRLQNIYEGNASGFDPDTPKIVTSANQAHGTPLTLLMSSWSPPANLKSNNSTNGCTTGSNGACLAGTTGTLIQVSGAYDYADYATYWYNSLTAYSALGVNPSYISIQNEPDFTATYTGCRFNPTEATYNGTNYAGYGLAFNAVYNKLQSMTTPPKMIGPETFSTAQDFLDMAAAIPASEITAYAHHLYNVSSGTSQTAPGGNPDTGVAALTAMNSAYPNAMKFETEYYDTPGFYDAWNIHNALVYGDDNAYVYWQATWPSTLDAAGDQAADQAGLIYLDNPFASQSTWAFAQGWTYNDSYYAMKHYSYYVRPGYVRYNATVDNSDERVSVYQSADKKTTIIVVLNVSATATDGLSLDLSTITYARSAIYRSTFSQAIKTGERWASLGTYTAPSGSGASNNSGGISLPPQSAVTIVLTN